ncbi:WecB/TagA/CpsF family glycosyltransferase [Clostridium akagii]|uniref:WecB/TagA/CpsF family glycosyltransferase n=1 Tax=Clostridium akagii TaxID=91623 RepID=UPI0004793B3A|nr:WecB/TagA/CpsF family glycosyltransferase [Clostridium akagii]
MFSRVLKYDIYNESKNEFIKYIKGFNKIHIISGNPEVLYNGMNDNSLFKGCTEKNSVIIPDGIGVVIASKIAKAPVKEKIAGIEVMEAIVKYCRDEKKGIYFLGAKQEMLDKCMENLKKKYSGLIIVGSHDGYFDIKNCEEILNDIKESSPHVLFVAMGSPKQERFINQYMNSLPASIYMGLGGSFDVISGKLKRAPRWMINMGLEWLYRVSKEPFRIKRLGVIPKFLLKVTFSKKEK